MSKLQKLSPTGNRLLVRPLAPETVSKGGIVLPESATKKDFKAGKVIVTGPGKKTEEGKYIPVNVQKDMTVYYTKYAGYEFEVDGEQLSLLSEDDVLLVEVEA